MSTSKHTPGPWAAYNLARGRILKSWRVCGPASPVCRIFGGQSSGDAEVANARLIAAAPDLLAALRDLLDELTGPAMVWGDGIGNNGVKTGLSHEEFVQRREARLTAAREALARATGA